MVAGDFDDLPTGPYNPSRWRRALAVTHVTLLSSNRHEGVLALTAAADAEQIVDALSALPAGILPLREACTQGGFVDESARQISVIDVKRSRDHVAARIGVFFAEVVGGCNCHDDPASSPVYARFDLKFARHSTEVEIHLLPD